MKQSKYKITDNLYRCECGKEFTNHQSLNGHFSFCKIHKKILGKNIDNIKILGGKKFSEFSKEELDKMHKKAGKTLSEKIKNGELTATWKGKKLPEEMKEKIRKGRVKFLMENPGQHGAWDKSNKSYLENWFFNFIDEYKLNKKYNIEFNYSFYPYFLDFAFVELKLDVEVDGKFHYLYEENINHDKKRNEYLENNGWKVYRISIDEVNKNSEEVKDNFLLYLKNKEYKVKSRYYKI